MSESKAKAKKTASYTIISTDGTQTVQQSKGKKITLEELNGPMGGENEMIEILTAAKKGMALVVDENGLPKRLAPNPVASALYGKGLNLVGSVIYCLSKDIE